MQKPVAVPARDPVFPEIFAVPITRDHVVSAVEHLVHLRQIGLRQNIVRIQHDVSVAALRVERIGVKMLEQIVEGETLADFFRIVALVHDTAERPRERRGLIRTVIRHDEDIHQLRGIIVAANALDELSQNLLLVARADDDSQPMALSGGRQGPLSAENADEQVDELMQIQ